MLPKDRAYKQAFIFVQLPFTDLRLLEPGTKLVHPVWPDPGESDFLRGIGATRVRPLGPGTRHFALGERSFVHARGLVARGDGWGRDDLYFRRVFGTAFGYRVDLGISFMGVVSRDSVRQIPELVAKTLSKRLNVGGRSYAIGASRSAIRTQLERATAPNRPPQASSSSLMRIEPAPIFVAIEHSTLDAPQPTLSLRRTFVGQTPVSVLELARTPALSMARSNHLRELRIALWRANYETEVLSRICRAHQVNPTLVASRAVLDYLHGTIRRLKRSTILWENPAIADLGAFGSGNLLHQMQQLQDAIALESKGVARQIEAALSLYSPRGHEKGIYGVSYINYGQVGAMGDDASASGIIFTQGATVLTPEALPQLGAALNELVARGRQLPVVEQDAASLEALEQARDAAQSGKLPETEGALRRAGRWAFDLAEKLAISIASKALTQVLFPGNP